MNKYAHVRLHRGGQGKEGKEARMISKRTGVKMILRIFKADKKLNEYAELIETRNWDVSDLFERMVLKMGKKKWLAFYRILPRTLQRYIVSLIPDAPCAAYVLSVLDFKWRETKERDAAFFDKVEKALIKYLKKK